MLHNIILNDQQLELLEDILKQVKPIPVASKSEKQKKLSKKETAVKNVMAYLSKPSKKR